MANGLSPRRQAPGGRRDSLARMMIAAPDAAPDAAPAPPPAAAQAHRASRRWRALGLVAGGLCTGLAGCADGPPVRPGAARPAVASGMASRADAAPRAQPCPGGLPPATRCLGGQDSVGAHDLIALPATDSD